MSSFDDACKAGQVNYRGRLDVTVELWETLTKLPPGTVAVLTHPATDEQYVVLGLSDFEALLSGAGAKLAP